MGERARLAVGLGLAVGAAVTVVAWSVLRPRPAHTGMPLPPDAPIRWIRDRRAAPRHPGNRRGHLLPIYDRRYHPRPEEARP